MRLATIGLLLALSTSAAYAEDVDMKMMNEGVTMLQKGIEQILIKYGVKVDPMTLSLAQLAEINGVVDMSETEDAKKSMIEAAIARK